MKSLWSWFSNLPILWLKRGGLTRSRTLNGVSSLVRAMDGLVSRKVMREVVAASSDRRQWGVLAAAWVGVSEREFFAAAAQVMGLPMADRVSPPDLTSLGTAGRSLLSELRRIGASVEIGRDRSISRVVCIDPAEVRGAAFFVGDIGVSIAPWTEISAALDLAESALLEYERNGEYRESKRRQEISRKILDIIIREARAYGARSVDVVTVDRNTRYQFRTQSGKVASGAIRPEVIQDLLNYLCSVEGSVLRDSEQGDVILRSLGSAANFRLSWGNKEPALKDVIYASNDNSPDRSEAAYRNASSGSYSNASGLEPRSPGAVSSEAAGGISGDLVLVVDDNQMFCRVLERLLKREGVQPCFAANGINALEQLKSASAILPKVIICDLHMPVMNGSELLVHLKRDERLRAIPVIVLTSDEDIDAELQLLADGADAFVHKAKDPRVLTLQVRRLLKRQVLQEAA